MTHFRATPYETKICPRRHAIRNPWIGMVHDVWRHTGEKLGADVLKLSNRFTEAHETATAAIQWRRSVEGSE